MRQRIGVWKIQDFNWTGFEPVTSCTIMVRCPHHLNYEAFDVGNWSFVGSNDHDIWNISHFQLQMWNQVSYDPRSYERNLSNCVYRSLKKFITARIIAYLIFNEYGFLMIKFKKCITNALEICLGFPAYYNPTVWKTIWQFCFSNQCLIPFFFQQCSMRQICSFHTFTIRL